MIEIGQWQYFVFVLKQHTFLTVLACTVLAVNETFTSLTQSVLSYTAGCQRTTTLITEKYLTILANQRSQTHRKRKHQHMYYSVTIYNIYTCATLKQLLKI